MNQETLDRLNQKTVDDEEIRKEIILETYFQFGYGAVAVVGMIVGPIMLQLSGVDFRGEGISWGPSIVAALMGVLLCVAWGMRFRDDRIQSNDFKYRRLMTMNHQALALTNVLKNQGLQESVVVDTSANVPQLVLQVPEDSVSANS